jgi:hypothetical protein
VDARLRTGPSATLEGLDAGHAAVAVADINEAMKPFLVTMA